MNDCIRGILPAAALVMAAQAQPAIPADFEIDGAADIRAVFDPGFTDIEFDAAKSIATDGETLIIGRTHKIDFLGEPGGAASIPGEVLIYRKNHSGSGPEFNLIARLNDTVVGTPGVSLVEPDDQFGWSVAIKGDTLVVGSPYYPHYDDVTSTTPGFVQDTLTMYGDEDETGAVFVYTRPSSASDAWALNQVIYDSQPVNGERFGHNVFFHDNRLLITAPRNFRPGYSDPTSPLLRTETDNNELTDSGPPFGGSCENISSSVSVYELSPLTGSYSLEQTLNLPFMTAEANYGVPPNGDPVDNVGDCAVSFGGLTVDIPPIQSRIGFGFSYERARDIAVDGAWLVAVGTPGMFVYEYDYVDGEYDYYAEAPISVPAGAGLAGSGYTSVAIHNDLVVVGMKKFNLNGGLDLIGGLAMYEFDSTTTNWDQTLVWHQEDESGSQLGRGVYLLDDTVVAYARGGRVSVLRYLRSTDELLLAGNILVTGDQGPANKITVYEDQFLLSDAAFGGGIVSNGPNKVRSISNCPYDLNDDGSLNFFDISEYLIMFNAGDLQADYAVPYGVLDSDDVNHYLALHGSGCP